MSGLYHSTDGWKVSTLNIGSQGPWFKSRWRWNLAHGFMALYCTEFFCTIFPLIKWAMRKHVFGYMWTVKTQISLHICAVWSGSSLSTKKNQWILQNVSMESKCPDETAHVQDDAQRHFFTLSGQNNVEIDSKHQILITLSFYNYGLWNGITFYIALDKMLF